MTIIKLKYNPDRPRDENGRWLPGSGGASVNRSHRKNPGGVTGPRVSSPPKFSSPVTDEYNPKGGIDIVFGKTYIPKLSKTQQRDPANVKWQRGGDQPQSEQSVGAHTSDGIDMWIKHDVRMNVYAPKMLGQRGYGEGWKITPHQGFFNTLPEAKNWALEVYTHMSKD